MGAAAVVLLAVLVFFAVSSWSRQPAVAKPSVQPIAFPHNVHVQTYKIDCQYCHADARRSEYAGLPSVERCMGCHKITAADKPEIKKLAEYAAQAASRSRGRASTSCRSSRTSRTRRTSAPSSLPDLSRRRSRR